jgi:hypothetical protein
LEHSPKPIGPTLQQKGADIKQPESESKQMAKAEKPTEQLPENIARILDVRKQMAKRAMQGGVVSATGGMVGSTISLGLNQALAWSWRLIFLVFPLIWINIHYVARYLMGSDKFCAFGEEWKFGQVKIPGMQMEGNMLEDGERILLGVLDGILLVFLVIVIGSFGVVNCAIQNPLDALSGVCF